jgi:3-oxoacyl-ACP reductase-like protein
MSIFSTILSKIFPSSHPAVQAAAASAPDAAPAAAPADAAPADAAPAAAEPVDVEAILNAMAAQNPEKLNWRTSIVDLMKLLGLDSSLGARKQLATELDYSGNMDDSASMNIWLHKQVMTKLAENGGKVPDDLKD